jgi:alpha-D-ribose 1-methylphosphonate 5-triphosphate synthase subunit PhnI
MYVAVKGGERAISNAHRLLAHKRRGRKTVPELSALQISEQLGRAVDRVMAEGSLYDPELAAIAIKQACGDLIEAIFLVRAYRTTLPRLGLDQHSITRIACLIWIWLVTLTHHCQQLLLLTLLNKCRA